MIADFKPYPEMKDSGVPWLGDVPEHWEVLPNRALFTEVKERDHPDEQMLSVTITRGVIRQQALLADSSKKDSSNQDKSAYKLVRLGDIAYNKMRAWQGAIGVSDFQGIVSPAYVVQRPRGVVNSRYAHHILRTPAFAKEAERWSYGITSDMWSLRPEHFKMIYSCLPPLTEQATIVRFLDLVDRRIWRTIRAKQKLIKLLEEQKQAIIHRTVTRGLDPNVNLKPSGIEWLGDIPEHWKVRRMKYLLQEMDQRSETGRETLLRVSQYTGITPRLVQDGSGRMETRAESLIGYKRVYPNAMVINIMLAWNGSLAVSEHEGIVSPAYCVYQFRNDYVPWYFHHMLRTALYKGRIKIASTGVIDSRLRLYSDDLGRIDAIVPPNAEQRAIVDHINKETSVLTTNITHHEREISLLLEYRTRLIADVVTGKLDVREAAAQLPDEAETPEPLDEVDVLPNTEEGTDEELDAVPEEIEA